MLNFAEIKTALFNSKEIQNIPDKWEESIPFFCTINGKETVAFLYWNISEHLVIKQLIAINQNTKQIIMLKDTELTDAFGLRSLTYSPIVINDYDIYFSKKDRYEKVFSGLCASNKAFSEYGQEMLTLLKYIMGDELFTQVISLIASEYVAKLSV